MNFKNQMFVNRFVLLKNKVFFPIFPKSSNSLFMFLFHKLQGMIISGNADLLNIEKDLLRNRYICERHFKLESFTNATKSRLTKSAVPEKCVELGPEEPGPSSSTGILHQQQADNSTYKTYKKVSDNIIQLTELPSYSEKKENISEDIINMPVAPSIKRKRKLHSNCTPRENDLLKQISNYKRIIKNKSSQISHLKRANKILRSKASISFTETQSKHAELLINMQKKKERVPWTTEEKNFSLMLFYKSPSAYKFLRKLEINLPSPSTIHTWVGTSKFKPGFSPKVFHQLKCKFAESSEEERACILSFDEMALKKNIFYSKDLDMIEGFEDLGKLGRNSKMATCALVFLIRGLHCNWKIAIGYFLTSSGIKASPLTTLIKEAINNLFDINLRPKAIVCDQGTSNQSAVAELGCTIAQPYFFVGDKKVYCLYDVPHLFKSIRNNLLNGDYVKNQERISFLDVIAAYNIDKKSTKSRCLLKITQQHIQPNNFQKMNVKLAVQVLSHTMAAAIRTCIATKEIVSLTAPNTANFIDLCNKTFDALNSRVRYCANPYACALSDEADVVMKTLKDALEEFKQIQKMNKITGKLTTPPCFTGLQLTIRAVLSLYEDEKALGHQFILTNRLNQDVLENLFSVYRQHGGFNRNPTCTLFRKLFRSNAIDSLLKPSLSSNCEDDSDVLVNLQEVSEECTYYVGGEDGNIGFILEQISSSESGSPSPSQKQTEEHVTLEECSVSYFAGYLVHVLLKEFNCITCKDLRINSDLQDGRELLLLHKSYCPGKTLQMQGLKAPSDEFKEIIDSSLQIYESYVKKIFHKDLFKNRLLRKIQKNEILNNWINECSEHRLFLIDKMLTAKIHFSCKLLSGSDSRAKNVQKLKILTST